MKHLILKTGESIIVDNEDFERLNKHIWRLKKRKNADDSIQIVRNVYKNRKKTMFSLANEIFNESHYSIVIRKNCYKLDFRKSNLEIHSKQQLEHVRGKRNIQTSSKYKGVFLRKRERKWESQIYVNYKQKHLGYFLNETDAAMAYNAAVLKYFGEHAFLNKIDV